VLPGPVAVVAGTCPQLRGFHGRQWESEPGNLHLSAAIPLDCPSETALSLGLVPTLAARDAIVTASAGTVLPRIKWVNDLYVEGGKAGGVLTRTAIQGSRAVLLLVGIGVNVQTAPAIRPTPFVPWAEAAGGVDLDVLLQETLAALERRLKEALDSGFREMSAEYRAASNVIGRRVRVYTEAAAEHDPPDAWPPPLAAGVVQDIRDDLSLVIEGVPEPIATGRLAFEADCHAFGLPPL
jgi:biotin-[acetyl-CoA-carboxylase] ligase BirA-like protein